MPTSTFIIAIIAIYNFILKKTEQNVSVSSSDAYKIIGNAVPCMLAYNIAQHLSERWERYFGESK